jgi:hypothetical protein
LNGCAESMRREMEPPSPKSSRRPIVGIDEVRNHE